MKGLSFVVSGVLGVGAMLTVPAPAGAHVVVSPEVVTAGDYATLTVSVPTEKEIPTTKIRVEVPEGFLLSGVQPVPGWEHTFQEDGRVEEWTAPPDSEEPASVIEVVSGGSEHLQASPRPPDATPPKSRVA